MVGDDVENAGKEGDGGGNGRGGGGGVEEMDVGREGLC